MYNWVTLLYSRDWHNIVNQIYFIWKKKKTPCKHCPICRTSLASQVVTSSCKSSHRFRLYFLIYIHLFLIGGLIALQLCVGSCCVSAWISRECVSVPFLWSLPPTSHPVPLFWVASLWSLVPVPEFYEKGLLNTCYFVSHFFLLHIMFLKFIFCYVLHVTCVVWYWWACHRLSALLLMDAWIVFSFGSLQVTLHWPFCAVCVPEFMGV